MAKKIIGLLLVILIAGGAAIWVMGDDDSDNNAGDLLDNTSQSSQPEPNEQVTEDETQDESQPANNATEFIVNADDNGADVMRVKITRGKTIKITFNVSQNGTYHGGLQFKSDVVSTGAIAPGDSETVTFTADQSFDFVPYWYAGQVKKDYVISIEVE